MCINSLCHCCSVAQSCLALCNPIGCRSMPILHHLLELIKCTCIESVMPPNYLVHCHPFSSCPQSFPASGFFSSESAIHIMWPKYWSFSFSISPFNEYSGLISFRIDWFDLLTVQGSLKSLLQHQSSKPSVLWHSAFFMVTCSHPFLTKGFTGSSVGKESACSAGHPASVPRSGRSPGGGHGNPLQYSCLENPKDREAGRATVHGLQE